MLGSAGNKCLSSADTLADGATPKCSPSGQPSPGCSLMSDTRGATEGTNGLMIQHVFDQLPLNGALRDFIDGLKTRPSNFNQ